MRAAIFHEPGNLTAGDRPDAAINEPSDTIVRGRPLTAASSATELSRSGAVEEIQIGAIRRDGTPHEPRPIWIVRAPDQIYVRAACQRSGWHRIAAATGRARVSARSLSRDVTASQADASALELIDDAYREKYGSHYVRTLIRP